MNLISNILKKEDVNMLKDLTNARDEMKKARVRYYAKLQNTIEKVVADTLEKNGFTIDRLGGFWITDINFYTDKEIEDMPELAYEVFGKYCEISNQEIKQELELIEVKLYNEFFEFDEFSQFTVKLMNTGEIYISATVDKKEIEIVFEVKRMK